MSNFPIPLQYPGLLGKAVATNRHPEKPLGVVVGWGSFDGKMCLAWVNSQSGAVHHTPVSDAVFGPFPESFGSTSSLGGA